MTGFLHGVREKNPPVTALPCQPPLGKGAEGTGDADCHSQCAHWLRNDTLYEMRYESGRATARVAPTDGNKECDAEEESPSHGFAVPAPLGKGAGEDGGKQRLFDTIKPPPGGGGFRRGICGEGDLRGGGLFSVGRFWNQSSVWAAATALEMICTSWAGSSFSGTSSSAKWR